MCSNPLGSTKKKGPIPISLDPEAIFCKSKVYILRGLRAKDKNNFDEYQLWASLALELLAKTKLARIHPSLIVDPTHYISLFAASGIVIKTDIKTISAKTVFERLSHLSSSFNDKVKKFCDTISQRRNAELHSGEVPFKTMKLEAWEKNYWHTVQIILDMMSSALDEWLGANNAKAPMRVVKEAQDAIINAAKVRFEIAKDEFQTKSKKEQECALQDAETKKYFHYQNLFQFIADAEWECSCPACGGKAFLAGMQFEEKISEEVLPEEEWEETVDILYIAEEFSCPVCHFHLNSQEEIEAFSLNPYHTEIDVRELKYEPEYGND